MKIGKQIIGICCCFLCVAALQAGNASDSVSMGKNGWFTYAPYGKSLLSDVHPNFVRFEVVGNTNHQAFDFTHSGKKYRPSTQGCFGMDLPVWNGNFGADRQFGISITLAASAYLWMDLFESQTSPVINTDYRIGLPTATFIHRLNRKFLRNYSVAWSPFKHESTHIGDEMQIQRMEAGYAIRRVNVSYIVSFIEKNLNRSSGKFLCLQAILGFPGSSAGKESTFNAGDLSSIPGSGGSPGEGIGYLLQYS